MGAPERCPFIVWSYFSNFLAHITDIYYVTLVIEKEMCHVKY